MSITAKSICTVILVVCNIFFSPVFCVSIPTTRKLQFLRVKYQTLVNGWMMNSEKQETSYSSLPLSFSALPSELNNSSSYSNSGTFLLEKEKKRPIKSVAAGRFVSWILMKLVQSRTEYSEGLDINVLSDSNRQILRGRMDTVQMKFDKIQFGQLFVSGGGQIILQGVDLRMRRLLFQNLQTLRKPYRIYGDFLLTQSDIVNSKFIKSLIQRLVNFILERVLMDAVGILQVAIKKVTIRSRRIHAQGEVCVGSGGPMMSFEVSTGAGVRDGGQVLFLKDIQVAVNPDSSLRTAFSVPLNSVIDVDLGEHCRLESFVISNKHVWIRAVSDISPVTPFAVAPCPRKAQYHFDLSALLSSVLRFHGGVVTRWISYRYRCFVAVKHSCGHRRCGSLQYPRSDTALALLARTTSQGVVVVDEEGAGMRTVYI